MTRSYKGADINIDVSTDYSYHLADPATQFRGYAKDLEFRLEAASDFNSYKTEVNQIKENMIDLAKMFILSNGTYDTGQLYDKVDARVDGNQIRLFDTATDGRGRKYAGHIEYGFTDRQGNPRGPWPFLRPALHAAAANSTDTLGNAIINRFFGANVAFGRSTNPYMGQTARDKQSLVNQVRMMYGSSNRSTSWSNASHGIRGLGARSLSRKGIL